MERWLLYTVATVDRFHCSYHSMYVGKLPYWLVSTNSLIYTAYALIFALSILQNLYFKFTIAGHSHTRGLNFQTNPLQIWLLHPQIQMFISIYYVQLYITHNRYMYIAACMT